ncbi:hypothetical protein GGR57DRAFT_469930 [Xylariaceae sp. FL1272]|nr:hypothetical protein GGR57DRAFT_469930 [Xylariaceae sp. FL1272]
MLLTQLIVSVGHLSANIIETGAVVGGAVAGSVNIQNTSESSIQRYRDELDHYDQQIEALTPGEWPAPPTPRAPAVRLEGKEFSEQKAREYKAWNNVQSFMYGQQSAALRVSDKVHSRSRYEPGTIFSAPYHQASSADEQWVPANDPHNTATPYGIVHSKYRKLIVLRRFGVHCICVPIYSHRGRGLSGKDFADEFVSIRDVDDHDPAPIEGEYEELLAVSNSKRGLVVAGKSCVHLTETYCHRFDAPATMEGWLDHRSQSTERLLDLSSDLSRW